jgi:hypothetical protein
MNEKIKELAIQVIGDYSYGDYWPFFDEELEKFAELIIRKCAKVADLADENKCEWIGGNILNHFGVRE